MKIIEGLKAWGAALMASQLRLPSGMLASLTGNRMNQSNELLYRLTLNSLGLKDNDSVLEIGFGNGKFFAELNSKADNLTITGIDHSPQMVMQAIKRNKDLYKSGIMKLSAGSSDCLPFEENSFDKILCVNVIYFWENPVDHFKEIHRVLKPGGYFCIGFRPKENLEKFSFSKFGFTLYTAETLKNIIAENGFQFLKLENGKELERELKQENTPFESLCMACTK